MTACGGLQERSLVVVIALVHSVDDAPRRRSEVLHGCGQLGGSDVDNSHDVWTPVPCPHHVHRELLDIHRYAERRPHSSTGLCTSVNNVEAGKTFVSRDAAA
jgi:hypothetical protein